MTDKEEILSAISALGERLTHVESKAVNDKQEILGAIGLISNRLTHVETKVDKLDRDVERYGNRLEIYQKASDRLIGLVTTIIAGASAVIILAPLGRVVADFSAKALGI